MAPTTARTNNNKCKPKKYNKPRRGTPTPFSSSALLVAAVYSLAAVLILQGAVTPTAAMKVDTVNTEDDVADMIEDFAREVMSESVFDMYDQKTRKLLNNSKAAILNVDPDDPDHLDVAMFVDHEDEVYEPGSNQTVQMCDFEFPYKCEKETPYFGAPEDYQCGASDETLPATGFTCTNITAVVDDDGDLSLIDEMTEPTDMCVNAYGEEVQEPVNATESDDGPAKRRRLLQIGGGSRSRSFRSGSAYAFGGGGRGNRQRSSGRARRGSGSRGSSRGRGRR